jgi:hypothetical protein
MAGLMIICGCAAAPASSAGKPGEEQLLAQNTRTSRLIIKFRNSSPDAAKPEVAESLSATAGVRLVYVRAVSGGAHVFNLENTSGSALLAEIIMKLSARPDIMYVEEDRIMRHYLDR